MEIDYYFGDEYGHELVSKLEEAPYDIIAYNDVEELPTINNRIRKEFPEAWIWNSVVDIGFVLWKLFAGHQNFIKTTVRTQNNAFPHKIRKFRFN